MAQTLLLEVVCPWGLKKKEKVQRLLARVATFLKDSKSPPLLAFFCFVLFVLFLATKKIQLKRNSSLFFFMHLTKNGHIRRSPLRSVGLWVRGGVWEIRPLPALASCGVVDWQPLGGGRARDSRGQWGWDVFKCKFTPEKTEWSPPLGGWFGFLVKTRPECFLGRDESCSGGETQSRSDGAGRKERAEAALMSKEMSSVTGCKSIPNFPFSVQFWETIARGYFCLTKYLEIVYEIRNMQIENKPFPLWRLKGFLANSFSL